jgi:hypothetical protein
MTSHGDNALSLIQAVSELVAERRTGVLDVRADGVRTAIYFEDGKPLFAEDDGLGETFGRLLVRQGVITNEQFIRVIDEMTRTGTGDNQLRFGEVAVGQGILTPEQVERGLADQVCGIISRALARDASRWAFDASGATKPPRSFSLEIDPVTLAVTRRLPAEALGGVVISAASPNDSGRGVAVDKGQDTSRHAARMAAEQAFQKGLTLLHASQTASAASELRRASTLQPESLEYLLYATWAEARRRGETPGALDQRTLLEIAQRAKRRDPTFAFGSYVLGELAMWAGDDATAKKWFYEALRLDPTSEAGREVRILARRGTGTVAPPATGERAHRDETPERAPLPGSEPVETTELVEPLGQRGGPRSRWTKRLVPGVVLLATAAVVMLVVVRKSAPSAASAPASSPERAPSTNLAMPVDAEPADTAAPPDARGGGLTARDAVPGKKPRRATSDKALDGDDTGTVRLPSHAAGHRIFVDGRRYRGEGIAPLHLPCGPHVIQIGSGGTPQRIDLPCRGEVQLE